MAGLKIILDYYLHLRTFKPGKKIVVFETDDWGSIRSCSAKDIVKLNRLNKSIADDPYIQNDTIASAEDLSGLFEILASVKDKNGLPAKMTFNVCVANPDFDKIASNNFESFFYEEFTETIGKMPDGDLVKRLWKVGIENNLFAPQLHGREHLHALMWLKELREGNNELLTAFKLGVSGIPYTPLARGRRHNLQAALDRYGFSEEASFQKQWLEDANRIFIKHFGFTSLTFIPPAYTWHSDISAQLMSFGIKGIQGIKLQYHPKGKGYQRKIRYTGQNGPAGLVNLVRNAFFEPSIVPGKDWVDKALFNISKAFDKGEAAIVGCHRINFIGRLNPANRDNNLQMFTRLLKKIVTIWPDVEFKSSNELLASIQTLKSN